MRNKVSGLYAAFVAIYCAALVVSNVIASKVFVVLGFTLPAAVIIFPVVYILNDVIVEVYGSRMARRAIMLGFAANIMAVVAYNIAIILPSPGYMAETASAMRTLLGTTWRTLVASLAAYIAGSFANAGIMSTLKRVSERSLMLRCVLSTLVGEGIDAGIFITIVFVGIVPTSVLLTMIAVQAAVKTAYEILAYPVTRKVIFSARTVENEMPE